MFDCLISDVKQFKSYKATYCLMPDLCPIALDATNGTAAAIHISGPLFVTQLSMPTTNKLSVYANYFTDSNKLADYSLVLVQINQMIPNISFFLKIFEFPDQPSSKI